jgi:hypothetical protein
MGNTAVAVLHYDKSGEIANASPRMARAMRDMPGSERPIDFGFGAVISWDHASGYQVCVIHGNTGWRVTYESDVPDDVLQAVADRLKMRGWKCTPPKSK